MTTDAELLSRFVADRSEAAFTELVHRHLPLVRGTAMRRLGGNAHSADDVTQQVFVALARKASKLQQHVSLEAWLYVSTLHASAQTIRGENRRRLRESATLSMQANETPPAAGDDADRLLPLVDDALIALKPAEREAVVLRFFANHSYAELGRIVNLSEDAARKRVDRALEKLHAVLARRGVTSSVAALAGALNAATIESPPTEMAARVARTALSASNAYVALPLMWPVAAALVLGLGILTIPQQQRENRATAATIASFTSNSRAAVPPPHAQPLPADVIATGVSALAADRTYTTSPAHQTYTTARVQVLPGGTLMWEGEPVSLKDFLLRMKTHRESASAAPSQLVVEAGDAEFRNLSWVLDEARKSGIQSVVVSSDALPNEEMGTWGAWF